MPRNTGINRVLTRGALRLLLVAGAMMAAALPAFAQSKASQDKLTSAVDKLIAKRGIHASEPGVAILVHGPGKALFMKGYGLANLEARQAITPRTLFELASVSKTFTATAVLILFDRGQLDLDDDVRKHLPELPNYDSAQPIRIRNLLQHTSGLPDYMDFSEVPARNGNYQVNDDFMPVFAKRKQQFPLEFKPGAKYSYNNTNFMLLATIAGRVSKQSFGKFLHDEIFVPMGMKHSFLYDRPDAAPPADEQYNHAVGYQWKPRKKVWAADWGLPPDRNPKMLTVGDGSIWTNLEDMLQWDEAVRGQKLLKPATWKLALTRSKTRDGKNNDYGLGWQPYCDDSGAMYGFGHDGSWGGFETSYYRYLTTDRTTVLLSNRGNIDNDGLWKAIQRAVESHATTDAEEN